MSTFRVARAIRPIRGQGAIGRLFGKMLGVVRRVGGGGAPGADAPTHRMRSGSCGGAEAVLSTAATRTVDDEAGDGWATLYPEWDVHRRRYRPEWCTPPHHQGVQTVIEA